MDDWLYIAIRTFTFFLIFCIKNMKCFMWTTVSFSMSLPYLGLKKFTPLSCSCFKYYFQFLYQSFRQFICLLKTVIIFRKITQNKRKCGHHLCALPYPKIYKGYGSSTVCILYIGCLTNASNFSCCYFFSKCLFCRTFNTDIMGCLDKTMLHNRAPHLR